MTKQQHIEELTRMNQLLEENVKRLEKKVADMIAAKDDDFSHSTIYAEMRRELLLADTLKDREGALRRHVLMDQRAYDEYKKVLADNRELCGQHGAEYWIGIASRDKRDEIDAQRAQREIGELKAALEAKDIVITHLKQIIAGEEPTPAPSRPVGSPKKIDEETKKRVRGYRKKGWTMQQIADEEGISKGSVAGILKAAGKKK
ncbi:MAG: hypothetical protein IKO41_18625 [Lachnospiraceae bacterium]|nr:hypothetical protein [Lachnospiraceae bacterium]